MDSTMSSLVSSEVVAPSSVNVSMSRGVSTSMQSSVSAVSNSTVVSTTHVTSGSSRGSMSTLSRSSAAASSTTRNDAPGVPNPISWKYGVALGVVMASSFVLGFGL